MPKIREYFSSLYERRFTTYFENTLKVGISLTDHIESQLFWQGVQEGDRGEVKLLKSLLQPQHVFLDIGANIGAFSLAAADIVSRGEVHAFEPSVYHTEKLYANLLLNQLLNISVHAVALSNVEGTSNLYFPKGTGTLQNTGMASQFPFDYAHSRVERIKTVRLDDYLEAHDIRKVDVIKVDVEGAELNVLLGGIKTICHHRPHILMEVNHDHLSRANCSAQEIITFWQDLDYELFKIGNSAELTPIRSLCDLDQHQNLYCRPAELAFNYPGQNEYQTRSAQ